MQDQPQPAWEEEIKMLAKSPDAAYLLQGLFEQVLATERVKWQEKARREIEENYGGTIARQVLQLPSLTPPPHEETK